VADAAAAPRPPRAYAALAEIEEIVRGFEDRTLPKARWTHAAHLTVAAWYLSRLPREEASRRIREGIPVYNVASGTPNTDTGGYHESITVLFIAAVARFLDENRDTADLVVLTNRLLASPLGRSDYPLGFYTRERLFSVEARRGWVPPDLRPLP